MVQENDQQNETPHNCDALARQADEYLNGWKRAKADLINFQRETEKRQRELFMYAHAGSVLSFIPLVESVEAACSHMPADVAASEWGKGVTQLQKQTTDLLKELGVEKIVAVGQVFSVDMHEAVGKRVHEGASPGTVIEEVQIGYTMHGKVLRPTKVIVADELIDATSTSSPQQ